MSIAQIIEAGVVANAIAVDPSAVVSADGKNLTWDGGEYEAPEGLMLMMQEGAGIGWTLSDGVLVAPAAPSAPAPTKADLLAYAAQKRFEIETGGIVVDGTRIDTSRASQNMISNADRYAQASGVASVRYKAASGWITPAAAPLHAVALAVGAHVQACFDIEYDLDAAIEAGSITTMAEIDTPPAPIPAWPANS
jgi:hypothetical protein